MCLYVYMCMCHSACIHACAYACVCCYHCKELIDRDLYECTIDSEGCDDTDDGTDDGREEVVERTRGGDTVPVGGERHDGDERGAGKGGGSRHTWIQMHMCMQ